VLLTELLEQAGLPKGVFNLVARRTRVRRRVAYSSEGPRHLVCRLFADRKNIFMKTVRGMGKRVQATAARKTIL